MTVEERAEEYADRCACLMEDIPIIERAYKTGAEYGYNKAKEEDKELKEENEKSNVLLSDIIEAFLQRRF